MNVYILNDNAILKVFSSSAKLVHFLKLKYGEYTYYSDVYIDGAYINDTYNNELIKDLRVNGFFNIEGDFNVVYITKEEAK